MSRTFRPDEAAGFNAVIEEVKRITEEILETDLTRGTARPPGASLGLLYERLGVHLVAMYHTGAPPSQVISLLMQVAEDIADMDAAALMMAMFDGNDETPDPGVVWKARGPDEVV